MLRHLVEEINEGYYSDSSESEQEEIVEQEAIVPAVRRRPQPAIVPAVRRRPQPAIVPVTPENSIKTERDGDLLMHDGYQFWKQDVAVKKTYWRCVKVTEEECKARVHTDNLTVPVRNVKNEIKRRAVVTMEKPSQIFNTILRGVPEAVQATLDKSATRQVVQKKRRRVNQGNQVPAAANGINFAFPDAFKTYKVCWLRSGQPLADRMVLFHQRKCQTTRQCKHENSGLTITSKILLISADNESIHDSYGRFPGTCSDDDLRHHHFEAEGIRKTCVQACCSCSTMNHLKTVAISSMARKRKRNTPLY
uniref:FLYWCH-type domain-containing protein n=1 Tax=Ditylenchus dipsaci TaxID=166011 RepID=A0A915DYH3_9BILA